MGTITQSKRKDGWTANIVQIRNVKKGETVYQESQAFDRKASTQAWIRRREAELYKPGAIEKASRNADGGSVHTDGRRLTVRRDAHLDICCWCAFNARRHADRFPSDDCGSADRSAQPGQVFG